MTVAPEVVASRGDAALAERIAAELSVATDPGAAGDAGVTSYLAHLTSRMVRAALEAIVGLLDAVPLPAGWSRVVAWAIGAAAVAAVALVLLRALRRRRRRGGAAETAAPEVVAGGPEEGLTAEPDAAARRRELEAMLSAGRVREALGSLWWWLARALAGDAADPSWTGRELLERAGRPELLPQVRRLEAMTYGRRRPAPAELRRLVAELEGALP